MWSFLVFTATIVATQIELSSALYCYSCTSAQAGCGSPLDIRMQRWHWCPDDADLIENFCVRRTQTIGSKTVIDRGCLSSFLKNTWHRTQMPTVRRHGYCEPGRSTEPGVRLEDGVSYCFCNDWNGCNTSAHIKAKLGLVTMATVVTTLLMRWFL